MMFFSTIFQSYHDNLKTMIMVIMKGCVQSESESFASGMSKGNHAPGPVILGASP